jgi:hypothetical protein
MGEDLLRTFVSRHVQPLPQQEMTLWMYLGLSCPDHPFSVELDDTEINTQIRGVLAHGADHNFGSGPIPLREGVDNRCVSLLELTSICFVSIFASQHIRILMQGLRYCWHS